MDVSGKLRALANLLPVKESLVPTKCPSVGVKKNGLVYQVIARVSELVSPKQYAYTFQGNGTRQHVLTSVSSVQSARSDSAA